MMMTRPCDALPPVRGTYTSDAPLKDLVWFRAGGPAEILFRPADAEDLATFLAAKPADIRVRVIGVGSNLLIRDGGIPGVVVRLPGAMGKTTIDGTRITAGAAALDANVARLAADAGIAGLEFLRGIPGTVGTLPAADMGFVYRKAQVPDDLIFVSAVFEGTRDDPAMVRARMDKLVADREASQPVKTRTGGSTFKNPPGHKAWQLIDEAGCRGLMHGAAQVSQLHCNFLINTGDATAADIEALGEEVRARVRAKSGVELEWEIKRVGVP